MNVEFCLPEFSETKIVSWKCHVDNKTNSRYDVILGRYLLTALGLDLKFSKTLNISDEGPCEECSEPMTDLSNYDFKFFLEKYLLFLFTCTQFRGVCPNLWVVMFQTRKVTPLYLGSVVNFYVDTLLFLTRSALLCPPPDICLGGRGVP